MPKSEQEKGPHTAGQSGVNGRKHPGFRLSPHSSGWRESVDTTIEPCMRGLGEVTLGGHTPRSPQWAPHSLAMPALEPANTSLVKIEDLGASLRLTPHLGSVLGSQLCPRVLSPLLENHPE